MSNLLLVMQREFLERVRTRSFVLSTILIPVFILAVTLLPLLFGGGGGGERQIAVVDEAPAGVVDRFVSLLDAASAEDEEATSYTVERITTPLEEVRDGLQTRVLNEDLDGYVWFPSDVMESSRISYRASEIGGFRTQSELARAASEAVRAERLEEAGIDEAQVAALVRPVQVDASRLTESGDEGAGALATFGFVYIVGMLSFFLITFYGQNVMRSVLEEKTNRIVEVIVSSVRATHLMAGKILGVAGVALLQVAIWGLLLVIALTQSHLITDRYEGAAEALRTLQIAPTTALVLVGFVLFGFLLYAAMFAAVGAAVTTEQEAQQFIFPVMIPFFIPLLFIARLLEDPLGTEATVLGLVPFTSPMAMPMRIGAASVPPIEIATSLALLALTAAAVSWLAAKIYRVGTLSTGKRPTLRELGSWLRAT